MKTLLLLIASILAVSVSVFSQTTPPGVINVLLAPSGSCNQGQPGQLVLPTGAIYTCQNITAGAGTWTIIRGATIPPTTNVLIGDGSGNGADSGQALSTFLLTTSAASSFPTLNQNTTGNAATATALATNPTTCSSGQATIGINAAGTSLLCFTAVTPPLTNTLYGPNLTGSTQDARITTGLATLGSTGGTLDFSGEVSTQVWSACPWTGITAPIVFKKGAGTTSLGANCTIPANVSYVPTQGGLLNPSTFTLTMTAGSILAPDNQQVFASSYTGTVTLSPPGRVPVGWFGPDATGANDSTVRLQNAINASSNGACLEWQGGNYLVTSLVVPSNICWEGGGSLQDIGTNAVSSVIYGTSGYDTIVPNNGTGGYVSGWYMRNLTIGYSNHYGNSGIHIQNAGSGSGDAVGVYLDNVIVGGLNYGFLVDNYIERSIFVKSTFAAPGASGNGGTAGFALLNSGSTTNNYMDKCEFVGNRFVQGVQGFLHDTSRASNGNTFIGNVFNGQQQYGLKILGAASMWHFTNNVFEIIGSHTNSRPIAATAAFTTGTTSSTAATTITVASATNLAASQFITVQAGNTDGSDLYTCVASSYVSGTSIPLDAVSCTAPSGQTLTANVPAQVTSTEVTNAVGELIYLGPPSQNSGKASNMKIETTSFLNTPSTNLLYAIDGTLCNQCEFDNVIPGSRPIYDPYGYWTAINTGAIRNSSSQTSQGSVQLLAAQGYTGSTTLQSVAGVGNPGKGITIALSGTGSNGVSGIYGSFNIRSRASGLMRSYFGVSADTGTVQIGDPTSDVSPAVPNLLIGSSATLGSGGVNTATFYNGTAPAATTNESAIFSDSGSLHIITTQQHPGLIVRGVQGDNTLTPTVGVTGTGCTAATSVTGNTMVGSFLAGGTGTCTYTLTWTISPTNGQVCANLVDETASPSIEALRSGRTATTATFNPLVVTNGDKVTWLCPAMF